MVSPCTLQVSPRVLACMIAGPVLNVMCFTMGAPTCLLPAAVRSPACCCPLS